LAEEALCSVLVAENRRSGVIEDCLPFADIEQFAADEQMRQLWAEFGLDAEEDAAAEHAG
jgi:hypothetical protein